LLALRGAFGPGLLLRLRFGRLRRNLRENLEDLGQRSRGLLEPAARLVAREDVAGLPLPEDQVRVAALGARLGNRTHREGEVALRVVDAPVEGPEASAPLGDDAA